MELNLTRERGHYQSVPPPPSVAEAVRCILDAAHATWRAGQGRAQDGTLPCSRRLSGVRHTEDRHPTWDVNYRGTITHLKASSTPHTRQATEKTLSQTDRILVGMQPPRRWPAASAAPETRMHSPVRFHDQRANGSPHWPRDHRVICFISVLGAFIQPMLLRAHIASPAANRTWPCLPTCGCVILTSC